VVSQHPSAETNREWHPLTSSGIIDDLVAEYDRANVKHGENTLDGANATDLLRLAALVEEVGEVAELLTYDKARMHGAERLKAELVQVATVAATWASVLLGKKRKDTTSCRIRAILPNARHQFLRACLPVNLTGSRCLKRCVMRSGQHMKTARKSQKTRVMSILKPL
jgi:hypothetical protein